MRYILITVLIICGFSGKSFAQESAKTEIENVIMTLFDGMRAGDSSKVASTFLSDAAMQTVYTNKEGEVVRSIGSLNRFLDAVGTPHEEIWDEKISSFDTRLDGDLASVWTPYTFFIGESFSHCGVNSFQMAKLDGSWKIMYIVDTRRGYDCIE